MKKILVAVNHFTDKHLQQIQQAVEGWATVDRIDHTLDESAQTEAIQDSDIVVGWPNPQAVAKSDIHFCQLCSAGFDPYLDCGLEKKTDFIMCNAKGIFSVACAEQTLAMMFALSRRINLHIRDQQQHQWQHADAYRIVTGDTICVVGLGSIGMEIAKRCAGIGMNVIGVTRTGKEQSEPPVSKIVGLDDLPGILPDCDHVALSLPANKQTQGMFNEPMFRKMKHGSCFYNVGRGALVVESDLVKVLNDGHLFGAGLDVFETEPLPTDHPLWDMPNVIVLPHTAGRYVQEYDRLCDLFIENLKRYRQSQLQINVVDLSKHS